MARRNLAAAMLATAIAWGGAVAAWGQAQPETAAGAAPVVAVVEGLSPGDLLNIRALASPTAPVILRLSNGSAVNRYACSTVNGYEWCKVAALDKPALQGWTPARYLLDPNAEAASPTPAEPAQSGGAAADSPASSAEAGVAELPEADSVLTEAGATGPELAGGLSASAIENPGGTTDSAAAGTPSAEQGAGQPDADADPLLAFVARQEFATNRAEEALSLAFAAPDALLGAIYTPDGESQDPTDTPATVQGEPSADLTGSLPVAAAPAKPDAGTQLAPDPAPLSRAGDRPKTTPVRTAQTAADTLAASGETVLAQAEAAAPAADPGTVGEIPCARYIGQPMTRCRVAVAQVDKASADVTVSWPDGGERVIRFRGGQPEGANSRGEFRFTREGDLNLIRIGVSERFEIPDAVPFGE